MKTWETNAETQARKIKQAIELILSVREDTRASDLDDGVDIVALKGRLIRIADALSLELGNFLGDD